MSDRNTEEWLESFLSDFQERMKREPTEDEIEAAMAEAEALALARYEDQEED